MAIRVIVGAVLSAIVLMAWGFVFWTVLPYPMEMMDRLPDDAPVVHALEKAETGVYFLPYPDREAMSGNDPEAKAAFLARHEKGPLLQVFYRKEGVQAMDPKFFAMGFGQMFVASFLAAVLLCLALPGLGGYPARVLFVFLLGVFASVSLTLGDPIWFHHPWKYALYLSGFHVAGWALVAPVLGLVVRQGRG